MSDIAVLEKVVIVHVWEEEELDYETSEAYLIKPGYAMYVLTGTVHLARVERIYQTGLHRFYVEDRSTASIQLASCLTGDISVKIQEIVNQNGFTNLHENGVGGMVLYKKVPSVCGVAR
ncbi:hypothetical protein ACTP13_24485 [Paenibacillus peoriae]|uniref:hypothetical protein n=1 Tax=Paenibacillus peoriae TaxID=59893 RepID=UPI003F9C4657